MWGPYASLQSRPEGQWLLPACDVRAKDCSIRVSSLLSDMMLVIEDCIRPHGLWCLYMQVYSNIQCREFTRLLFRVGT